MFKSVGLRQGTFWMVLNRNVWKEAELQLYDDDWNQEGLFVPVGRNPSER